ncbi:MAG TPA: gliding motility-associated C-terminal domain-containing protein, partial [Mucilaginibacter sp.]
VVVGHSKDLSAGVGKYYLEVSDGYCSTTSATYEIKDASNQIDLSQINITDASCGMANGGIYGIKADQEAIYAWTDQNGVLVGSYPDLSGVISGKYILTVSTRDGSCSQATGPIQIKNGIGPTIDDSKPTITNTNCSQSTGSIKNIIVTGGTGTKHFSWKNNKQQEVGTSLDLTGQPAGKYILHVTDDTQCGEIISSTFEIKTDGAVVLDESAKNIQPATCEYNNGGIKGITATGATIYKWYNTDNQLVSNKPDLDDVAPGSYYLVASNSNGCSAQSPNYTIDRVPRTTFGTTEILKNTTCGEKNGAITIIFEQPPTQTPESFRWVNHETGVNVAITKEPELKGIEAGNYDVYVTEYGGCEYKIATYPISNNPALSITTDNIKIEDDHCENGAGSIINIKATGTMPLTVVWTNDKGQTVGNALNLENVQAGNYHIQITDGSGCTQGLVYTINDIPEIVSPQPSVTNVDLCTTGTALLQVNDIEGKYSYRLYDNADSATPIDEQQNGRFAVNVDADRSYYISKFKGNCESNRAEVKVKVGLSSFSIANTFTPNGDGSNDYWKINNIESYPAAVVQIFNRNGQKLFESKGYATPFNGTYNGKALPVGTYYYIINLNKNCSLLSGSLTILR